MTGVSVMTIFRELLQCNVQHIGHDKPLTCCMMPCKHSWCFDESNRSSWHEQLYLLSMAFPQLVPSQRHQGILKPCVCIAGLSPHVCSSMCASIAFEPSDCSRHELCAPA